MCVCACVMVTFGSTLIVVVLAHCYIQEARSVYLCVQRHAGMVENEIFLLFRGGEECGAR